MAARRLIRSPAATAGAVSTRRQCRESRCEVGAHALTRTYEPHACVARRGWGAAPDLVVADHGYAGAAGTAGIVSVGFADCNDPALFVGEAEGDVAVCVPLDDNVEATLYEPLTAFLLSEAFG